MTTNKTTFTWNKKTYQLNISSIELYNSYNNFITLPNGEVLEIKNWKESSPPIPIFSQVEIIEATEIDEYELAFKELLNDYKLSDNPKTRKLWSKCYDEAHAYGLEEIKNCFHNWVDIILE